MAARGLLRKTLFPPSVVSCLQYHLFYLRKHTSFRQFQRRKTFFQTALLERKQNCHFDVDAAVDRAGYQSRK